MTFVVLTFFLSSPHAHAAEPCIKSSFRGDASTYNPFLPGWKTGGGTLATGGRYNPNEYEAALQLDLAKQYRCGYGSGAICHAVVQAPNGRAMTVRINDNGPLVSGRVIDLNEKSMQYLSAETMGRNSGVVRDVTVTLLCGIEGVALGPLDGADREAWASRTFDAPYANVGGYSASPFGNVASPVGYSSSAGGYGGSSASFPAASGGGTPQPVSQRILSGISGSTYTPLNDGQIAEDALVPPAASLIVQPKRVPRGKSALVSWTSVGMTRSVPCDITMTSDSGETFVGQGNEGSVPVRLEKNSPGGMRTLTMRCTTRDDKPIERTAELLVE